MASPEVAYWKSTLEGAPALTEAPTDRQRPAAVCPGHCALVKQQFPPGLLASIAHTALDRDVDSFLAAVWQVLLSRYSRSEDVVTGVATERSGSAAVKEVIGLECNPVPLRTGFADPSQTFKALLRKVSEALTAAQQHSATDFLQVVEAVKSPRTKKNAPVFQALLLIQESAPHKVVSGIGVLDFVLELARHDDQWQASLHYNTDLFDKGTAQRMLGHFMELCSSAVTNPDDKPVAELALITAPEVTQVLKHFNAWDLPYTDLLNPEQQTIHGMFEHWARHTPEQPSLTFGETTLSFGELDARANQLAHHLIQLGAAPERPVGILVRRCLELFTGLLAILKSGSAYVPMDPDYPAERLAIMAGDSKAPVILSQSDLQDKVSEVLEAVKKDQEATGSVQAVPKIVLMDTQKAQIAQQPKTSPCVAVMSTNMCYIIFTSGSTGRPKGTVLQHAGVVNYFLSLVDKLKLTPADAFLQKAPISFDASVQELFNAFACGGRVVLAGPGMEKDTQALARLMAEQAVTNMSCVPSQLEVLLMESELEGCTSLRHVLVGGEALPPVLASRFAQRLPNAHLHNAYGPTETTVDATGYDVTAEFKGGASVPIGRPINNMRCYVLDKQLQLLPVGMAGELMVSGIQLAREYLHNPEKTAASFIQNPHNHDNHPHHARMYRTGDLARWLLHGNIEFLGRLDDQVKLRGFRIELGEVEAVLMEAPGVKLAAAIVMKDPSATDRLVGFVSPDNVDRQAIIAELKQRLPAHFVPSLIMPLAEMPLSPAGKVDRKKLRSDRRYVPNWTAAAGPEADEEYAEPESELERQLQAVWQEVLAQDAISVTSDFFHLGGTSLRVGMMMAKVRASIWSDAPTALLFRAPTIRGLTEEIKAAKGSASQKTDLAIPRAPFTDTERAAGVEVLPMQADLLQPDPTGLAETQETAAWHLEGAVDTDALQHALAAVAQRHELLRSRFWRKNGKLVQSVDGEAPKLELKPLSKSYGAVQGVLQEEASTPLDPVAGTAVLKATLLGLDNNEITWVLLLTLHRVAGNHHSLALLGDQLAEAYAALKGGSKVQPTKGLQFLDILHWQRQPQQLQKYEPQHLFWLRQLAYAPPQLFLPYDDLCTDEAQPATARSVTFMIPGDLVSKLASVATSCGATLFMTLMTTWQLLLARYSRAEDVITLTTVANNLKRPDLEGVLGPFGNTVAIRTDLSGAPTFRQLLGRVKAGVLSALVHSDVPFEAVMSALCENSGAQEDVPRFQSALNLEDGNMQGLLPGLCRCGLTARRLQVPKEKTPLDTDLFFYQVENELQAELTYSAGVFAEDTAKRFAESLQVLLRAAAETPDEVALDLPLVPQADLGLMLLEFNDTLTDFPADKTINQLFEGHASAQPDAICLVDGDSVLTYAEVDRRANQLAYHLVALGVSPGATVMLLMHSSPDAIVSMLAVLKAGCAYSALSPKHDELGTLILDASPALVITHKGLHGLLPRTATPLKVFNFDAQADNAALAKRPARQLPARASPGEAAVVEYVPGPNNRPLGVVHAHVGLVNAVVAGLPATWGGSKAPPPHMLLHSDLTAVGSLLETWVPLLHGGRIIIAPSDEDAMRQLLSQAQVTAILMEGPEINGLLEDGYLDSCESLRTVWLWNEQHVTPELVDALTAALPDAQLYQGFDAVECAFFVTLLSLTEMNSTDRPALHGQPLPNIKVYVLDERMKPVPLGVPGRLYVSGVGLARGYLHKPQLTAEAFIANPFFDPFLDPPAFSRLFDTQVLSRWLPGGTLDFVGHAHRQVMLRGAHVPLGEVEAVLEELPGVEQAVALVQEDPTGVQRLVAYVTPCTLSAPELMAGLRGRLPARMMPSTITPLAEFPRLMVSQRVDHVSLPQPDWGAASSDYVGPSNGLETSLQKIVQEVLKKERLSVTANFFAEGGSQEQAAEVMRRLHGIAGQELPSSMLARSPTVQGLAETLAAIPPVNPQQQYAISHAPFTPAQRAAGVPCAAMQETAARSYLTDREGETVSRENIPSAFRMRGQVDVTALQDAIALLIERHEVLRAKYVLRHGEVLQVIGPPQQIEVVQEQLQPSSMDHLMRRLQQEAAHRFDLEHDAALVHAVLFHMGTGDKTDLLEEHVLLLVVSHICSDGWSEKVCMDEVAAAYNAFAESGHPPVHGALPDLPVGWVDYCFWQRGRTASGAALEAQRRYWRKTLAGAPSKPSIRTDFEMSAGLSSPGKYLRVTVPTDLTQGLESLALACGATLFTVAMAAWQLLLSQYSMSKDIVVLTAMAGRPTVELAPLVGWFACGCAIRSSLEGADLTVKQLLDRVRQAVQGAFANSELPSDHQVRAAGFAPEEERRIMPTFFALHDASFFLPPPMTGLAVSRMDLPPEATDRVFGDSMLEMELLHLGGQLSGTLAYNTGLFRESTAERVASQFQDLLGALVHAGPTAPVASLPVLSEMIRRLDALDGMDSGSSVEEREAGGMLPNRKSLVPRKTFMGNLRSLASALPQLTEDSMNDSSMGKQLHGVGSYAPGSAAAITQAGSPARDSSEQLVEVHSRAIVQALRVRDSTHPSITAALAVQPGMQSRSSFLPSRSSAQRSSQGSGAPHGFLSHGSFAQQQSSSTAGQPAGLGSRASRAPDHQRRIEMAARRAAGHSTQKLSSMTSTKAVPTPDALGNQWRPGGMFKEGADIEGPAAADGSSAASPFLSVVLPARE